MKKIITVFLTICMIAALFTPVCLAEDDGAVITLDFNELFGTDAETEGETDSVTRVPHTRPVRDNSGSLSDYTVLIVAVIVAAIAVVGIGAVPAIIEKRSGKTKKKK